MNISKVTPSSSAASLASSTSAPSADWLISLSTWSRQRVTSFRRQNSIQVMKKGHSAVAVVIGSRKRGRHISSTLGNTATRIDSATTNVFLKRWWCQTFTHLSNNLLLCIQVPCSCPDYRVVLLLLLHHSTLLPVFYVTGICKKRHQSWEQSKNCCYKFVKGKEKKIKLVTSSVTLTSTSSLLQLKFKCKCHQ